MTAADDQKILWEAVIEIAHLRAEYTSAYVDRKQKAWRKSSWTSADADRFEREAVQRWNANHPALIALWTFQKAHAEALKGVAPAAEDPAPRVWQAGDNPGDDRALLADAITYVTRTQNGAPTAVQRNIRVGWAKACRLIGLMETWGVVGPSRGSAARAVLLGAEQGKALAAHLSALPTPGGAE